MDEPVPHGATVSVDDRQLLKTLHWYDGLWSALRTLAS